MSDPRPPNRPPRPSRATPQGRSGKLTRRQVLALLAVPPVVAAFGVGGTAIRWWDQPADAGYACLSPDEAAFLRALAAAGWPATTQCPLDGGDADLDRFVDANLVPWQDLPRKGMRAGLHVLDTLPIASTGQRFSSLSRDEAAQVLADWLDSDLMPLRQAITGLVVFLGMGYTVHPDTQGMFGPLYGCGYGA